MNIVRYCFNLGLPEASQIKLVKEIVNKSLDRSQGNAREGKPPLTYQENVDLARGIVSNSGYSDHQLFRGRNA